MILRRHRAPVPEWDGVVARIGGVPAVRVDDTDAPDPRAIATARDFDRRSYEEPADILARIEREVTEPGIRARLDTMLEARVQEQLELMELEDVEFPDNETRLDRFLDVWVLVQLASALIVAYLPADRSLSVPLAAAAGISVVTLAGAAAVHRRRVKEESDWRVGLSILAAAVGAGPLLAAARLNLTDAFPELSTMSIVSLATLGIVAVALTALALLTPTAAAHLRSRDPDDPRELIHDRVQELLQTLYEDGPSRLRTALEGRDDSVARASRPIVVEAIRILLEREQIDRREAEWMVREALGRN